MWTWVHINSCSNHSHSASGVKGHAALSLVSPLVQRLNWWSSTTIHLPYSRLSTVTQMHSCLFLVVYPACFGTLFMASSLLSVFCWVLDHCHSPALLALIWLTVNFYVVSESCVFLSHYNSYSVTLLPSEQKSTVLFSRIGCVLYLLTLE